MRFVRLVSSLSLCSSFVEPVHSRCEKIEHYVNAGAKGLPSSYTRKEFERSSSWSVCNKLPLTKILHGDVSKVEK